MSQNLPPHGDPEWVQRAIASVAAFHPDPSMDLYRLLGMWRWIDMLTADQQREVVGHFDPEQTTELGRRLEFDERTGLDYRDAGRGGSPERKLTADLPDEELDGGPLGGRGER